MGGVVVFVVAWWRGVGLENAQCRGVCVAVRSEVQDGSDYSAGSAGGECRGGADYFAYVAGQAGCGAGAGDGADRPFHPAGGVF